MLKQIAPVLVMSVVFLLGCGPDNDAQINTAAGTQLDCNNVDGPPPKLVRFPPKMPKEATKSGHCILNLEIDENGRAEDVKIVTCSEPIFEAPSIKSVYESYFGAKVVNCKPVTQVRNGYRVTYRLFDENGHVIAE